MLLRLCLLSPPQGNSQQPLGSRRHGNETRSKGSGSLAHQTHHTKPYYQYNSIRPLYRTPTEPPGLGARFREVRRQYDL
jgi:hypothetical protein